MKSDRRKFLQMIGVATVAPILPSLQLFAPASPAAMFYDATGADTNVPLTISPKAGGMVRFVINGVPYCSTVFSA